MATPLRPKDIPAEATSFADVDEFILDSSANGTRRITGANVKTQLGGLLTKPLDSISDLSTEAAASGYSRIVQDLNRGGIFKAVNGGTVDNGIVFASATVGWTWQRQVQYPILSSWFGAVGDGSTDDRAALQAAIDYINTNGGKLIIKEAPNYYKISGPLYWYKGEIEFEDNALIWNTTISPEPFWERTAIMIGSYFGYDSSDGVTGGETAYSINAGVEGDTKVTLVTAADALNFIVGDVVYMHGSETYSNPAFYSTTHVSEVTAIDADNGYIYLENPLLPLGITTDGVTSPKIYRNTNTVLCNNADGSGKPEFAKLAVGVKLINGQFKQTTGQGQCVHISCHKSDLHFKYVSGDRCFGVNPCSYSRLSCDLAEYEKRSLELAYFHHDVTIPIWTDSKRDIATQDAPEFALSEYGQFVKMGKIHLNERVGSGYAGSNMSIATPYNYIDDLIIRGTKGIGLYVGAEAESRGIETVIKNLVCSGSVYEAAQIHSSNVTILNIEAPDAPTDDSKYTVRIKSSASNVKILGGYLGEPGANLRQCVRDEGGADSQNIYANIQQCISQRRNFIRGEDDYAEIGSGETVIQQYLIPEDSTGFSRRNIWKCLLNIAYLGTSGFKKVTVRMVGATSGDSITFYTETFLAAETGRIALDLNFSLTDSPSLWVYNGNYTTLRLPSTKAHDAVIGGGSGGPDITTEDCNLEIAIESDVASGATYAVNNLMVYPVNEVKFVF